MIEDEAIWAELQDMHANERREYEAKVRGARNNNSATSPKSRFRSFLSFSSGSVARSLGDVSNGIRNFIGRTEDLNSAQYPHFGTDYINTGLGYFHRGISGLGAGGYRVYTRWNRSRPVENNTDENDSRYQLLNDETDDWGAVADLDAFFNAMYNFYLGKGFATIAAKGVANLVILGFAIFFSTFLFAFVDWNLIMHCRDESSCYPFHQYISSKALYRPDVFHLLFWVYFLLFLTYWLWTALSLWDNLKESMEMKYLYMQKLKISQRDLCTIPWNVVVDRFIKLQSSGGYGVTMHRRNLTAHDIASRIMRKENYLIAMMNKGVLTLNVPIPTIGSILGTEDENRGPPHMTKSLEWTLRFCVLNHMFNHKFTVRRDFLDDPKALQNRFLIVGLAQLALMPFLLLFMVMYFFLQNAQEWHASKDYLGPREWSPSANWTFREFNELQHIFERRMAGSYGHANSYLNSFPSPIWTSFMRTIRFISGSFVGVLLAATALEDSILLHVKIWDRNLLWYVGIFSALYAFSRAAAPRFEDKGSLASTDVEEEMLKVAAHTHYLPKYWRGGAHRERVRNAFTQLFPYRVQLFYQELIAVLLGPIVLCISLRSCAVHICNFVREHTEDIDGIGAVCTYSRFDFTRYGNEEYGAPHDDSSKSETIPIIAQLGTSVLPGGAVRTKDVTDQGKMEKSFLNFKENYPEWKPDAAGQEMLKNLRNFEKEQFEKQKLQIEANGLVQSSASINVESSLLDENPDESGDLLHDTLGKQSLYFGSRIHDSGAESRYRPAYSALTGLQSNHRHSAIFNPSDSNLEFSLTPSMVPSMQFSQMPSQLLASQIHAGGIRSHLYDATPAVASFYWLEKYCASRQQKPPEIQLDVNEIFAAQSANQNSLICPARVNSDMSTPMALL